MLSLITSFLPLSLPDFIAHGHMHSSFIDLFNLNQDGLVLALGAIEATEASALPHRVVAEPSARAVSALGVAVALHHIGTRRALQEGAIRTTSSKIADATRVHVRIPGSRVCASGLSSELSLGEADTSIAARVGADSAFACNAVVVGEACAFSGLSVTHALV